MFYLIILYCLQEYETINLNQYNENLTKKLQEQFQQVSFSPSWHPLFTFLFA